MRRGLTSSFSPVKVAQVAFNDGDSLMLTVEELDLSTLFKQDETAWLEIMASLAAQERYAEMDFPHLGEYLKDMARRDQREVYSRLVVLMCHLLKWDCQPDRRSGSWRGTIRSQRRELRQLLESGTLRNHAGAVLADAFEEARRQASDETELALDVFPAESTRNLDDLLAEPEDNH